MQPGTDHKPYERDQGRVMTAIEAGALRKNKKRHLQFLSVVSWYGHSFSASSLSSSFSAALMKASRICVNSVCISSNLLDSIDPFGGNPQLFRKSVSISLM